MEAAFSSGSVGKWLRGIALPRRRRAGRSLFGAASVPRTMATGDGTIARESLMRDIGARHPRFAEALVADAAVTARYRGERHEFRSSADAALQIVRLAWSSDAFLAQAFYRAKARLQGLGVPLLPRICHRLAIAIGQVQ